MGKIEDFRAYAERALRMAGQDRKSFRERALLLGVAQGWLELAATQWGLVPAWSGEWKAVPNAAAETVSTAPWFRDAFRILFREFLSSQTGSANLILIFLLNRQQRDLAAFTDFDSIH